MSWEKTAAIIAAAVKAGTHSDVIRTVCNGCGEWCDGHVVGLGHPGGGSVMASRGLGTCCAPKPKPADPSAELQKLGPSTLVAITPAAPAGAARGGR